MNTLSTTAPRAEVDTGLVRIDDAKLAEYERRGYPSDVLPLQPEQRSWGTFSYITLWMGPIHNIMSYMTVAGFFPAPAAARSAAPAPRRPAISAISFPISSGTTPMRCSVSSFRLP